MSHTKRHTHSCTYSFGKGSERFLFTPSAPERATAEAAAHIIRAHGAPFAGRCKVVVTELPDAANTRANGVRRRDANGLYYVMAADKVTP